MSYSYVMLCLTLLFLSGCDDKVDMRACINASSYLNAEGSTMAILVGSSVQGQDRPAVSETHPVILHLNNDFSLKKFCQLQDEVFREMDWRPNRDNCFYYVTYEKIYGSGSFSGPFYEPSSKKWFKRGTGTLMKLDADLGCNSLVKINQDDHPVNMTCLRWSPDGSLLAGLIPKPSSELQNSGTLAISYDGGRTSELTKIDMYSQPVWLNNKELYLMVDHDHTIARVLCDGSDVRIAETFSQKDCQILFEGIFKGEIVYTAYPRKDEKGKYIDKSRRLFVGDRLIYETDNALFRVFVFPQNIVLEADNKILIFDKSLFVCHEKTLGLNMHILNFQQNTNIVFLTRNWEQILYYNYTKQKSPHFLFSIDMLNGSSD